MNEFCNTAEGELSTSSHLDVQAIFSNLYCFTMVMYLMTLVKALLPDLAELQEDTNDIHSLANLFTHKIVAFTVQAVKTSITVSMHSTKSSPRRSWNQLKVALAANASHSLFFCHFGSADGQSFSLSFLNLY